jgi:hypothetical protein
MTRTQMQWRNERVASHRRYFRHSTPERVAYGTVPVPFGIRHKNLDLGANGDFSWFQREPQSSARLE